MATTPSKATVTPTLADPAPARKAAAKKAPAKAAAKAPATKAPAKAAAPKLSAADRLAKLIKDDPARAKAVPGYDLRWPHGSYDLFKRAEGTDATQPLWVIRCAEHGKTTTADDVKAADALGRKADRAGWCSGCKAKAKAAAAPAPAKATKAVAK